MSQTSKSPRTVALTAIRIGERNLPTYAHHIASRRRLTSKHAIAGRSYWSQGREMLLLAITHNIMILWRATLIQRFSTEHS